MFKIYFSPIITNNEVLVTSDGNIQYDELVCDVSDLLCDAHLIIEMRELVLNDNYRDEDKKVWKTSSYY